MRRTLPRSIVKAARLLLFALLGLCLVGLASERIRSYRARSRCPPHGTLVQMGGYRLLLDCIGQGSPTVVFDSGALDASHQWSRVQPEIAEEARACSFDRPGLGWSDRSPHPPSFKDSGDELHSLLERAHIPPPYVLVGHSNGGLDVQYFAHAYPHQVAGIVLVDSVHADETLQFPSRFQTPAWGRALFKAAVSFGVARLFGWCDHTAACPDCTKFTSTLTDQLATYAQSEAAVRTSASFGSIPLVVLEHDPQVGLSGERDEQFENAWISWQQDLANRSSASQLRIVPGAGHEIQTDQPAQVIRAIDWVLLQSKQKPADH